MNQTINKVLVFVPSEAPPIIIKIQLASHRMIHFAFRQENHLLQNELTQLVQGARSLQGRAGKNCFYHCYLHLCVCVTTEKHFIRDLIALVFVFSVYLILNDIFTTSLNLNADYKGSQISV